MVPLQIDRAKGVRRYLFRRLPNPGRAQHPALWDGAMLSRMLAVDAVNVIGSRPTGWWRDRPGAARRFAERVRATVRQRRLEPRVVLVFEDKPGRVR